MDIITSKIKEIDLKNKKIRIGLIAAGIAAVVVCVALCFHRSAPDPVWIDGSPENQVAFFNRLNDSQKREFFGTLNFDIDNKLNVTHDKTVSREGKKYSEIIKEWRSKFGKENCKKLDDFLKTDHERSDRTSKAYIYRQGHYAWVIAEGKKILNERFAPRRECVKIEVRGWNTGDTKDTVWLDCWAKFRDKSTGEETIAKFEITSPLDRKGPMIFTPRQ